MPPSVERRRFCRSVRGFTGAEKALLIAFGLALVIIVGALVRRGSQQAGGDAARVLREHGGSSPGRLQTVGDALHAGEMEVPRPRPAAKISPEAQDLLDAQIKSWDRDAAAQGTLKAASTSAGFTRLAPEEQVRLLAYAGGSNTAVSGPARRALQGIVGLPYFKLLGEDEQAKRLREFLTQQPGLPELVTPDEGTFDKTRESVKVKVSGPTEVPGYAFRSGKADAHRYSVEIDGKKIDVYRPKTLDPKAGITTSLEQIQKGLAALPPESLRLVRSVSVNPGQNPDDARWALQYRDPNFRSYMTADENGQISIYPTTDPLSQTVVDTTFIHETGHTLSLIQWGKPSTDKRWNGWKAAIEKDKLHVSGYGRASISEDFSESLALYMTYRRRPEMAELRKIYPNRFKILDGLIGK